MHLLNNFASTGDKIQLDIFTNLEGISSMPCAELVLMLLIQALTSCSVISGKTKEFKQLLLWILNKELFLGAMFRTKRHQ